MDRHTARPHGWESGLLFERTTGTLFCGDLFTQPGAEHDPVTTDDILAPSEAMRSGMNYFSGSPSTGAVLESLAQREPHLLATMHGSSYRGDGARLLRRLAGALEG